MNPDLSFDKGTRVRVRYLMTLDEQFYVVRHFIYNRRAGAQGKILGNVSGPNITVHYYVEHDEGEIACYSFLEMQEILTRFEREVLT